MIHFHTFPSEPRYLFLTFDEDHDLKTMKELEHYMNKVPQLCYMPQYHGIPYTEDFLFKRLNSNGKIVYYCAAGLWQEIYKYFRDRKIPYTGLKEAGVNLKRQVKVSFEEFKKIVDSWNLRFAPRPYQYECAYNVLCWKQSISQVATRAGKTLIAYIVFRYLIEQEGAKKILMIVPSVNLVKQGYKDFSEYAEFFKTECIWAKGEEVDSANCTIGTFQSLIKKLDKTSSKYKPSWFNQFDVVFVDEVHRATAAQVKDIITQDFFYRCKLVYGMTGTLPKENTIERFTLAALLGAKIQDISAKELQDGGFISNIAIHQLRIKYDDNEKLQNLYLKASEYLISDYVTEGKKKKVALEEPKFLYKYQKKLPPGVQITKTALNDDKRYLDYLKDMIKESDSTNFLLLERMVIHELPYRVEVLSRLIGEHLFTMDGEPDNGNWLVLTHHTEYTEYVYDELVRRFPNKKLFKITGSVTVKKREKIISEMKGGNAILVASYGCMSTGITLPNLWYGVLFESFKSNVVNVQSLGRGLGNVEGKEQYEVWDFVDELPTGKIAGQGRTRVTIYKEQKYPFNIEKLKGIV